MLSSLLHEIHRLRRFIRDAQAEIDRAPKVHKAHQAKVAAQEKALADAKDDLRKRKANILTGEAQIKSLNQALKKHEKQLEELSTPRDIEAKQHDIRNTKDLIAKQEDEILAGMTEVDERTAKLPELEAAVTKAKADFATYERESAERIQGLKGEAAAATKKLAEEEAKLPANIRGQYDRIVRAHGADSLAGVENQSCSHCRVGVTAQNLADLVGKSEFICCRNCGRGLYLVG
jgi:predicted  nucleic acid-binding Zn-ribbon protein